MDLTTFVFAGLPVIIQQYADFYKKRDLEATLKELESDQGLPRIKEYDFIVGESNNFHLKVLLDRVQWAYLRVHHIHKL